MSAHGTAQPMTAHKSGPLKGTAAVPGDQALRRHEQPLPWDFACLRPQRQHIGHSARIVASQREDEGQELVLAAGARPGGGN